MIQLLRLRIGANQAIEVPRLKLMRIMDKDCQIAHAEVTGTRFELIAERKYTQRGIAARTATRNCQAIAINPALFHEEFRAIDTVIYIYHAPLSIESLTIGSSVATTAAIVDIQYGKTT